MGMIRALWGYRDFIVGSVQREFQLNYQNSALGAAWMIIKPLALIIVYTVVFSQVMATRLPGVGNEFSYGIYLCAGLLTWNFFSESVTRVQNVFLDNANLLKKINFPRICLPIIATSGAALNFFIIFSLFVLFLFAAGSFPGYVFLGMLPLLLIQVLFALGLGLTLGVLNVFFRDVGQIVGVVLQFWFWLTPVVYPLSVLPEQVQRIVRYNPMTNLTQAYQQVILHGELPQWQSLAPVTGLALLLCVFGWYLFQKHAGEMVDEL